MLEHCVKDALKNGTEGFIFLGDYVTDGYAGNKVISFLQELSKRYPCRFIYGNREKYIKSYREMDDDYNK
jgi:predicted MPP superfamily phosphohydrolase